MSASKEWVELKDSVGFFVRWTLSSLLEAVVLGVWVAGQWGLTKLIITPLALMGFDKIVLQILQGVFAISTLAPIAITIYKDIRIMLLRTNRKIRKEIQR